MSSRALGSSIKRISQVTQQLSSQAPIKQQIRMAHTHFKLNTGATIPALGTYSLDTNPHVLDLRAN